MQGGFHVFISVCYPESALSLKVTYGRVHGCRYLGRRFQRNRSQLYLVDFVIKVLFSGQLEKYQMKSQV